MYIYQARGYFTRDGQQAACRAPFLLLMEDRDNPSRDRPMRAIVRKVALQQFGHYMMGTARIAGQSVIVSGTFGGDGLPCNVPPSVYEQGIELPPEIYQAWATNDHAALRKWAKENLARLIPRGSDAPWYAYRSR